MTKQEAATHPGNSVGPIGAMVQSPSAGSDIKEVDCGSGWNGLALRAVKAVEAKMSEPFTVTVNGTDCKCQNRQGKSNLYKECSSTKDQAEKVQLLS